MSRHRANEAVVSAGGLVVELEFGHRSDFLLPAALYVGLRPPGSNLIVGPDPLVRNKRPHRRERPQDGTFRQIPTTRGYLKTEAPFAHIISPAYAARQNHLL